ncbi:MAG: hypothetical protein ACT4PM_00255 [Gemmatimonadales bacterium]
MITYWVDAEHRAGLDHYLATRGRPVADRLELRVYEELAPAVEAAVGPHIFAALDQLSPSGRALVAALYDGIRAGCPDALLLNDPRKVLRRFDLLKTLRTSGANRFAVRRASEPREEVRFPVFVREESGHGGSLTGLLQDARSLSRALLALRSRGLRAADLLVVEFCDLADEAGRFWKAAAFKVGDAIVPAHLLSGRPWVLKWDEADRNEETLEALVSYVTENPHEAWLRRVFALAQVDYGRCDYGVRGVELQVWEINLNPTIGAGPGPPPAPLPGGLESLMNQYRAAYHGALQAAFRALDPGRGRDRVTVRLDPALISRVRLEAARAGRRRRIRKFLEGVYERPLIGRLFRSAYSRFLPRL